MRTGRSGSFSRFSRATRSVGLTKAEEWSPVSRTREEEDLSSAIETSRAQVLSLSRALFLSPKRTEAERRQGKRVDGRNSVGRPAQAEFSHDGSKTRAREQS